MLINHKKDLAMSGAQTIKKEIKTRKTDYSAKFKLGAITAYKENGYDLEKTAKQAGVSTVLISEWWKEAGFEMTPTRNDGLVSIELASQSEIATRKAALSLKLIKDREVVQQRMLVLAETSDDLGEVTKAFDAMTRAIKEDREESGASGTGLKKNSTQNVINNQYNQYLMNKKSSKKDGNDKA
jgi:transposase-like protein